MLRLNNNVTMCVNGVLYKYTIDDEEYGPLGILHVTNMFNIDIRKALTLLESKNAYVNSYNGIVFFKTKEYAEDFIIYVKKYNQNLM